MVERGGMSMICDDLWWLAETVKMEAGGESYDGQLAVAFVICTRRKSTWGIRQVVLAPLQFSCWNGASAMRVVDTEQRSAWQAAAAAYFRLADDPSIGATHYLRSDLAPKPPWFDPVRVSATIGAHTFLRLS